jgi:hypothetical protein
MFLGSGPDFLSFDYSVTQSLSLCLLSVNTESHSAYDQTLYRANEKCDSAYTESMRRMTLFILRIHYTEYRHGETLLKRTESLQNEKTSRIKNFEK